MEQLAGHPFVSLDVGVEEARAAGIDGAILQVVSTLSAVEAIIRTGACVGALPRFVADATPELTLCFPVPTASAIWLVYPERLRRAPDRRP